MRTTASDGSLRMENRGVNRKLDVLESDYKDPKDFRYTAGNELGKINEEFHIINAKLDDMLEMNNSVMDAIAKLRADVSNWRANGKNPQGIDKRGVDPLVEIKVDPPETKPRYYDSTLDRNACDGLDRVECPVFDRSTPFRDWLYRCEKYFEHYRISEQSKVRKAYYKLDGEAMEWHWDFMSDKRDRVVSWDEYVQNMALRFDRNRMRDPMVQLKKLQQVGSVEEYHKEFEEIRYQERWPESRALDRFLGGLKEKLQCLVRLNGPTTVAEACDYATVYEEALKPIPLPSPFLRKILDKECSRVEPWSMDNGLEKSGFQEVDEKGNAFEDNEAKVQNEEEIEVVVASQAIEGSMGLVQDVRTNAKFDAGKDQDVSNMKEENVAAFQVRRIIVGSGQLEETRKKELFDLLVEEFDMLHLKFNKRAEVVCLGGVEIEERYYRVFVAMNDHVQSWRCIVWIRLNSWNFSSIFNCSMTSAVAWNFKKRKKSARYGVNVLMNKDRSQEPVQPLHKTLWHLEYPDNQEVHHDSDNKITKLHLLYQVGDKWKNMVHVKKLWCLQKYKEEASRPSTFQQLVLKKVVFGTEGYVLRCLQLAEMSSNSRPWWRVVYEVLSLEESLRARIPRGGQILLVTVGADTQAFSKLLWSIPDQCKDWTRAHRLVLPATTKVHNVFHACLLKKCWSGAESDSSVISELPDCLLCSSNCSLYPARVLDRKFDKHQNVARTMWLIQW